MGVVKHTPIERATFEFTNRDGVPTKFVLKPDLPVDLVVVVSDDGKELEVNFEAHLDNNTKLWGYVGNEEDPPAVAPVATREPVKPMGKVGVFCWSVVGLAILTPLLGILWAWSAGVVRNLGGLW